MLDFPKTLLEFQPLFPDETACARHLERLRWPEASNVGPVVLLVIRMFGRGGTGSARNGRRSEKTALCF